MPPDIRCTITMRGTFRYQPVRIEETIREKVMGTFRMSRRAKLPNRMVMAVISVCIASNPRLQYQ